MTSLRLIFNEAASIAAGAYGAIAGVNIGGSGATVLLTASALAPGILSTAVMMSAVLSTSALGAAIGYRGAKALLSSKAAP